MSARTVAPFRLRRPRARVLLALVLLAAACLTETTGPQPGFATFLRDLAGNAQQGTVGAALAQPVGVTVVDLNGDPVPGVTVQWTTQHGVIQPQNGGATDAGGIARAVWTLGPVAGEQVASATVPDVGSAQFTVQALADRPAHIIALPDTLRFAALAAVVPIEVTVTDRFGNEIVAPAVTITVLDTAVARVTADRAIESRANGATSVEVRADTAVTLVRILVQQLSAGVVIQTGDIVLQAIADTARMSASALDANGHPVPVATIVWRSLAPAVATIDDSGLVRALTTGSTAVVAEVPGAADTVFVRVEQAAALLTVIGDRSTLHALGDTALFSAAVADRNGFAIDSATVLWQSLAPAVVDVTAPGVGVALAPGTARIVAHSGAVADTAVIDVVQIAATVSITNAPDSLFTGDLLQLNAAAADSNGAAIAAPQITWSASGDAVTVSPSGVLTAAAPGTALVTATAAAVDTIQVVVVDRDNGGVVIVTVSPDGALLNAFGDTVRLAAAVTEDGVPSGAPVAWVALDGAAVVDGAGLVTASANGTARVVASYGGGADTVLITVQQVTATLALTPALDTLSEGGVVVLSAVAADSNGFAIVNPVIAWSSSDEAVATVDDNGQVTGATLGTATITAVSDGVVAVATIVVVADLYALLRRSDVEQTGTTGEILPDSLLIQAYDTHEMVVPGVVITWSIVSGDGSLSDVSTTTDANGRAGVLWTLGPEAGTQVARAAADGVNPVDFLATAVPPFGRTRTWTGGDAAGPTDWSNANNWSPAVVPTASDTVIIGQQSNQPVLTARAEAARIAVGRAPGAGATLTLAGHTLEVFGDFSTEGSNGLLVMRNALDSLLVHGDADFAGRAAIDSLTAGVIRLRGHFRQTYIGGNWGSFAASGAHKVLLDGAAAQSVTFVNPTGAPGQRSFFRHVEVANTAGGVSFDSEAFVEGDLAVTTATTIAGAGPLRVLGSITTVSGSSVTPGSIQVNGAMAVSGSFSPGTTMLGGSGQIMQPGLGYQAVQVLGRVLLGGRTSASSVRVLSPGSTIDLNGHTFEVAGDFSTEGSNGLLVMRNALDSLLVVGDADFAGRAALDSLTAGVIRLRGDFRQAYIGGNWGSFAASGTHRVVIFDENPKTIHFDNPTGAPTQRSFFQDLELDNAGGDLTFTSAAVVTGRLTENAEGTHVIEGTGGATLTVGEPQLHDFGFRNLPLVVNGIGEIGLRHVFFDFMSTSATQLTVVHPGAATAFVLDSVEFMSLADTDPGRYVFADDADGNATPALALVLGPDPGNGALKTGTDGVAQVTWTGAPAGGLTRTWVGGDAGGPTDWDWFNPGNWSPAGVPGEADTVVIGAVPMAPVLTGTARVARVHITGTLTLGEAALVADVLNEGTLSTNPATSNSIAGNIDNRGPIIVVGSLAVLNSGRTFNTTAGNINVFGDSDTLTVAGGTIRAGSGSAMLGSGLVLVIDSATLVLESDFSTGEPEWETVNITVEGPGVLSVGEQLSTYGGTFDTDVVVDGSFDIEAGTTTINGTLTNRVDGSLEIDADDDPALLILPASFTNEGYFSMDGSSGARSMLRLLSGTLVNAPGATIEIQSDATIDAPLDNRGDLVITDTLLIENEGRTFDMTAGVLTLEQDGALEVNGGTVRVGEDDGDLLRFNGQGFPIHLLGAVNLIAETDFTWDDDGPQWHFTGTVTVDGPGMFINRSEVILTGDIIDAHLRNTGVLTVGAGDTSRINGTFENFGDDGNGFFIDGSAVVVFSAGFTNDGAIALRGTGATLAMAAGVLVNTGSLEVGSGAATVIGEIDNQNRIVSRGDLVIARSGANHVSSGTIEFDNGTVTFGGASLTSTETGNVFGPGTLDVSGLNFTNAGHVTPGFGTRLITIDGTLTDAATASLTIWIGGPPAQPELSDRVVVTGAAALTGTLTIELFGHTPVAGDSWTILAAQSVTGTFTTVNLPTLGDGLEFVVSYTATAVVLSVAPPP